MENDKTQANEMLELKTKTSQMSEDIAFLRANFKQLVQDTIADALHDSMGMGREIDRFSISNSEPLSKSRDFNGKGNDALISRRASITASAVLPQIALFSTNPVAISVTGSVLT
jgi:hypothetical protein